jgi:transcription elongation factor GreA
MSEQLLEKMENLLNEEKWTRATISNYTITNFESLDELFDELKTSNVMDEVHEVVHEFLKHNKNSIVALYYASLLQLEEENLDDSSANTLIKIFTDNHKWNIVEFLCQKVLSYHEDKFAIRTLISTYNNQNKKEELPDLWERLIKIDFEEAEAVVKLADHKESQGLTDEAISYYKKAINRYILSKNFAQVEELWKKLLQYEDVGYDYFFNLDKKISKSFSNERAVELLMHFYDKYKDGTDYDTMLMIVKLILEKNPTDEYARTEIVKIYRARYETHSCLEDYIKISNLEGPWRNIFDAIESFEKHISFDKGNFVYHRTWGIGRIKEVSRDVFKIDFQKKKGHKMSLKMALTSLQVLQKNHIWILKLKNMDKLKEKVRADIEWALKILILSYDNSATMKNFKEELVPDILTASQWTSWWTNARKILKTNPHFGNLEDAQDQFEVRDKPLSFEEKIYNSFKAAKDFNQRHNLLIDYIENSDPDPDYLEDMVNYFITFLNSVANVNEQTISSYLFVKQLVARFPFLKVSYQYEFEDFMEEIEDAVDVYQKLSSAEYKRDFMLNIKRINPDWENIYTNIFYQHPNKFIYDELLDQDRENANKIIKELVSRYKEYRDAFFWIVTTVLNEKKIKDLELDYDNIIFSLFHLIEITTKDINLKKEVSKNKKMVKQVKDYLFKNNFITEYIAGSDEEFCKRLHTIVNDMISLAGDEILAIKNKIAEVYPQIDVIDQQLKFDSSKAKTSIIDKLITTQKSYKKMEEELLKIKEVEIPKNSKEIGYAMEKGDLKENAEYKAAKEEQAMLQNRINRLRTDLSEAQVIKNEEISNDFITFGTHVILDDLLSKKTTEYTILGPYESDTEKNIISYKSPLGYNLLDKRKDDVIEFEINDKKYQYKVKEILVASF